MLDIAIIGAGPVGSRVAYKLAGMGYHVGVLEKRSVIGAKPCCTGIISQECAEKYDIPSEVIFRRATSAQIFSPAGKSIRVQRPEPQACIVDRPALDRLLAARARSQGAEYHLACKAENVIISPDKVIVESINAGHSQRIEARAVVLASGFSSALVKKSGLGQPGYQTAGVQAEVRTQGVNEVEVYFDQGLAPGFFAWLVPTAEGRALAGMMSRHSAGLQLRKWFAKLESQGRIIPEKRVIRYGGIPLKPLNRTYGQRLLVVGDAAGQVKPTTGGGIYFGMICADIASDVLHQALQSDDLSISNLSNYEKTWCKKLGHELRSEYYARKIYEHLSNKQLDRLFSILRSTSLVESLLKEESVTFDWHGGLMLKVLRSGFFSQASRLWRWPTSLLRR